MRALHRQPVDHTPVWFMRQAGRVLPEYRAVRAELSLLDICRRPALCAEVTLQPVHRFGMDAAILFADIMHPLIGAGVDLDIVDGVGPVIRTPVRSQREIDTLRTLNPEADLGFVLDTIRILKAELGNRVPLIGFSGAPFTLASYLIEGKASRDFARTKTMMYSAPALWHELMHRLTEMVIVYLRAQWTAGADALQLFDSWVGCLSPSDYERYVRPYSRRVFSELASSGAPMIHFGVNTATLLHAMKDDGAGTIGVDWRIPLDDAWAIIGEDKGIQGNLDPTVLFGSPDVMEREVSDVLRRAGGRPGHIFNLGHGLLPSTPLDGVSRVVDLVRALSMGIEGAEPELIGARS
jgi:uroporphyrinogen decarboxylase